MSKQVPRKENEHFLFEKEETEANEKFITLDYREEDLKKWEELRKKYAWIKKFKINLGKLNIGETTMNIIKLIGGILALLVAIVFVFIVPGAGFEQLVIEIVASIFGALGLSNWRQSYGTAKEWFRSKTIVSAILVAVGVIAIAVISFTGFAIPDVVMTILRGLITVFGGGILIGIFDATVKEKKKTR